MCLQQSRNVPYSHVQYSCVYFSFLLFLHVFPSYTNFFLWPTHFPWEHIFLVNLQHFSRIVWATWAQRHPSAPRAIQPLPPACAHKLLTVGAPRICMVICYTSTSSRTQGTMIPGRQEPWSICGTLYKTPPGSICYLIVTAVVLMVTNISVMVTEWNDGPSKHHMRH